MAKRLFDSAANDADTELLLFAELDRIKSSNAANECDSATRDDALFNSSASCVHGILDACLLFLHLNLGGSTDFENRNAANELGKALLELLAIVIA